uniref:VWFC domain-containing protein n=1 Tax=Eptatretus burgeri TaxID=7764 RepID=A0A8C4QNK2_EPTBU
MNTAGRFWLIPVGGVRAGLKSHKIAVVFLFDCAHQSAASRSPCLAKGATTSLFLVVISPGNRNYFQTSCVVSPPPHDPAACTDTQGIPRAEGEEWQPPSCPCCVMHCLSNGSLLVTHQACPTPTSTSCPPERFLVAQVSPGSCCPHYVCVCKPCMRRPMVCTPGHFLRILPASPNHCCSRYVCGKTCVFCNDSPCVFTPRILTTL